MYLCKSGLEHKNKQKKYERDIFYLYSTLDFWWFDLMNKLLNALNTKLSSYTEERERIIDWF